MNGACVLPCVRVPALPVPSPQMPAADQVRSSMLRLPSAARMGVRTERRLPSELKMPVLGWAAAVAAV